MKKTILFFIFCALFFFTPVYYVYAECYNEDACFKDYVSNKGENLVIAANRDKDQVELYWSDANQTWLKPDKDEQLGLQRLYNKKVQLREMQGHLDQMHRYSWYNTDQNAGSRQGQR